MSHPFSQYDHDEAVSVGALVLLVAAVPAIIALLAALLGPVICP